MSGKQKRKLADSPQSESLINSQYCGICEGAKTAYYPTVECDVCRVWSHIKCVGLASGIPAMETYKYRCESCGGGQEKKEWRAIDIWRADPAKPQPPSSWTSIYCIPTEWIPLVEIGKFTFTTTSDMKKMIILEYDNAQVIRIFAKNNRLTASVTKNSTKVVASSPIPQEHNNRLRELRSLCQFCSVPGDGFDDCLPSLNSSPDIILKNLMIGAAEDNIIRRCQNRSDEPYIID